MKCIVGLGNPGERYRFTRHNIGFLAAEALIRTVRARIWEETEFYAAFASSDNGDELLIVLPQTYMNESGAAVSAIIQKYGISADDMMVVYDDFHIPFGTLRMRGKGSDGGHNGMASVISHAESDQIPRLRIGVGGATLPVDHTHETMADYVLSRYTADEEKFLPVLLLRSAEALLSWRNAGIAKTMSLYNKNFFNDASAS